MAGELKLRNPFGTHKSFALLPHLNTTIDSSPSRLPTQPSTSGIIYAYVLLSIHVFVFCLVEKLFNPLPFNPQRSKREKHACCSPGRRRKTWILMRASQVERDRKDMSWKWKFIHLEQNHFKWKFNCWRGAELFSHLPLWDLLLSCIIFNVPRACWNNFNCKSSW